MKSSNAVVQQIKELRVNALYGKKKHYNAANRKHNLHLLLGFPALAINILLGSLLVGLLTFAVADYIKWLGASLSLIAALLSGLQTYFNFQRQVEGHRRLATRYLGVAQECSRIIAYDADGAIPPEKLREQLEQLARTYHEINLDAEGYPTNQKDYDEAKKGFQSGEEFYKKEELDYKGE